jgi:23S rRNA (guanosine2251-2'-O)-methyltransferase
MSRPPRRPTGPRPPTSPVSDQDAPRGRGPAPSRGKFGTPRTDSTGPRGDFAAQRRPQHDNAAPRGERPARGGTADQAPRGFNRAGPPRREEAEAPAHGPARGAGPNRPYRAPEPGSGENPRRFPRSAAPRQDDAAGPAPYRGQRPAAGPHPGADAGPRRFTRGPAPRQEEAAAPAWQGRDSRPARPARDAGRPPREAPAEAAPDAAQDDYAERAPRRPREPQEHNTVWLHGIHAVAAALANPVRRNRRLLVTAEAHKLLLSRVPQPWAVSVEEVDRSRFGTLLPEDAVHQGAALLAEPLPNVPLDVALAKSKGPVLLLDQVTDPRNVGAILRSAAAFGCAAVIMQDRHAPPETGALARTASGALEIVPVVREVNLARTILTLKRAGYWVMGLAGDAPNELAKAAPTDRPVALVLGAEDTGLRRLQRETCDELVRLPISEAVESLNVSVAAAVGLYELARAR